MGANPIDSSHSPHSWDVVKGGGKELTSCLTLFGVKYWACRFHSATSILLRSRFHSAFIQIIITQHHFIFHMSIMHQAWSIAEVRSLIFTQVYPLRDLVQLAATCKAFTKPATLELLAKQTSIARLKRLAPLNAPALAPVCVYIYIYFTLAFLILL